MSRRFCSYLIALYVATFWLWLLLLRFGVGSGHVADLLLPWLLGCLSILAYQFPVQLQRDRKTHVGSSPLLAGAFLLSGHDAMLMAAVAAFLGNALLGLPRLPRPVQRRPWWSWLFNAAQTAVAIGLAAVVYHALAGNQTSFQFTSPLVPVAAGLAAIVAYVANTAAVAVAVGMFQGGNPLRLWWDGRRADWRDETGLALLAVVTALLAAQHVWAVALQAGLVAIIQLSLRQSARVLRQTRDTIERLALIVDRRDPHTYQHSQNVSGYAVRLAECLGLPAGEVELIRSAASIHDIGKVAIREGILLKPTPLTDEELREI